MLHAVVKRKQKYQNFCLKNKCQYIYLYLHMLHVIYISNKIVLPSNNKTNVADTGSLFFLLETTWLSYFQEIKLSALVPYLPISTEFFVLFLNTLCMNIYIYIYYIRPPKRLLQTCNNNKKHFLEHFLQNYLLPLWMYILSNRYSQFD